MPQSFVLVHMWFNLADSSLPPGGDRDWAADGRDIAEEAMTQDQIPEAQRLAREWKPT